MQTGWPDLAPYTRIKGTGTIKFQNWETRNPSTFPPPSFLYSPLPHTDISPTHTPAPPPPHHHPPNTHWATALALWQVLHHLPIQNHTGSELVVIGPAACWSLGVVVATGPSAFLHCCFGLTTAHWPALPVSALRGLPPPPPPPSCFSFSNQSASLLPGMLQSKGIHWMTVFSSQQTAAGRMELGWWQGPWEPWLSLCSVWKTSIQWFATHFQCYGLQYPRSQTSNTTHYMYVITFVDARQKAKQKYTKIQTTAEENISIRCFGQADRGRSCCTGRHLLLTIQMWREGDGPLSKADIYCLQSKCEERVMGR